jgi:aromatic-L-amino-acid decarboxylase
MAMHGDMPRDELFRFGREVADWVADFVDTIEERPVLARVRPGDLLSRLPRSAPQEGESMEAILRDFREEIVPATTHWNHPGFFAYFANSASGPGILGDTLATALNVNAMLWRAGPAGTELEIRVCDWLRQMMGLPEDFWGHIEDTASVSTIVALAAARHQATQGRVRTAGLSGAPPLKVYFSQEANSSVERAAMLLGFGRENCRSIGIDAEFRMRPDLLARAIAEDRAAGSVPAAVVATVGTTSVTSVDPVGEIAEICSREGIWLHVDAAYGAAMAIVPEYRWVLEGCDRADSLVVNPHKWLLTPMDCSVLYCREPGRVREALSLVPAYLMTPEDDATRNLMDYGLAMGRRFRALKLWFILRYFGVQGMAERVRAHVEMAEQFRHWLLDTPEWEVLAPSPMSTVLYRHHPEGMDDETWLKTHNERLLHAVNRTGEAFLSHNELELPAGASAHTTTVFALRTAIGNIRTQRGHLERLWEVLRQEAAVLSGD